MKYDPIFCQTITDLISRGDIIEAVAEALGIHRDTLYKWQAKYPEVSDAIEAGRLEYERRLLDDEDLFLEIYGVPRDVADRFRSNI